MRRKTTEFIGNNIKYFIIAPLLTIAESSTELLLPFLMGRIVDDGLNAENFTGHFQRQNIGQSFTGIRI